MVKTDRPQRGDSYVHMEERPGAWFEDVGEIHSVREEADPKPGEWIILPEPGICGDETFIRRGPDGRWWRSAVLDTLGKCSVCEGPEPCRNPECIEYENESRADAISY
jgi:hypothetical protein